MRLPKMHVIMPRDGSKTLCGKRTATVTAQGWLRGHAKVLVFAKRRGMTICAVCLHHAHHHCERFSDHKLWPFPAP